MNTEYQLLLSEWQHDRGSGELPGEVWVDAPLFDRWIADYGDGWLPTKYKVLARDDLIVPVVFRKRKRDKFTGLVEAYARSLHSRLEDSPSWLESASERSENSDTVSQGRGHQYSYQLTYAAGSTPEGTSSAQSTVTSVYPRVYGTLEDSSSEE